MEIRVNGRAVAVEAGCTVAALLASLDAPPTGIAVARNDRVVRRASFESEQLAEGDRVEIIQAVAGG